MAHNMKSAEPKQVLVRVTVDQDMHDESTETPVGRWFLCLYRFVWIDFTTGKLNGLMIS